MAKKLAVAPVIVPLRQRIAQWQDAANAYYLERRDAVQALALGLVSGESVFFWGPPGTGKSAITDGLSACWSDGQYFTVTGTKFMSPDRIFGGIDYEAYKSGRERVNTAGKLPEAHLAFLDELPRFSDACLESLMKPLNEGTFDAGDGPKRMPLRMVVAAANSLVEGDRLEAFWDRLVIRAVVPRSSLATRKTLSRRFSQGRAARAAFESPATWTLAEIDAARDEAGLLAATSAADDMMDVLLERLERATCDVSERRLNKVWAVAAASAWLAGRDAVGPGDVVVALRFTAWDTFEQRDQLEQILASVTTAQVQQALRAVDQRLSMWREHSAADEKSIDWLAKARTEFSEACEQARSLMAGVAKDAPGRDAVVAALAELDVADQRVEELQLAVGDRIFRLGVDKQAV